MGQLRWGRILLFGFLAEIAVLMLFIPIVTAAGMELAQYSTPIISFAGIFVVAYWGVRRLRTNLVLHGLLIGVAAIAAYYVIGFVGERFAAGVEIPDAPTPPAYLYPLAHALKVIGGAVGGYFAKRQRSQSIVHGAASLS